MQDLSTISSAHDYQTLKSLLIADLDDSRIATFSGLMTPIFYYFMTFIKVEFESNMPLSPELLVTLINATLVSIAYLLIYPRFVSSNLTKLATFDLISSIISLAIAGSIYKGSEQTFSLIIFDTNWVMFSIIIYFLLESPFAIWYMKRHNIAIF